MTHSSKTEGFASDQLLSSPDLIVSSAFAQVSFRNFFNLEPGYDGGGSGNFFA